MAARSTPTKRPRTTRTDRSSRTIWHFGPGGADGHAGLRALLGGKGANLAEMCRIGLPVPPGFTIATPVCKAYLDAVGEFRSKLRTGCMAERIDLVDMDTNTPLDVALSSYLAKRAAQARAGRGAAG